MDFSPDPNFSVPHHVLLDGVAQCKGFGRAFWITKSVTFTNESRVDVACGICHSVKAKLVVDSTICRWIIIVSQFKLQSCC